jgi:hypothetical protein
LRGQIWEQGYAKKAAKDEGGVFHKEEIAIIVFGNKVLLYHLIAVLRKKVSKNALFLKLMRGQLKLKSCCCSGNTGHA